MRLSMKQMAGLIFFFGLVSFIFGVIAENKKPAAGTPIVGKDVVICKYPFDPTVALGLLSFAALLVSSALGFMSIAYPYNKKPVPHSALFRSKALVVFFNIAWLTSGIAAALLLWPIISEQLHLSHRVHHDMSYTCPTAKTGLIGGAAFVSLDSALIWLICIMLADNAREDFFDEVEESRKGEHIKDVTVELQTIVGNQN